MAAAMGACADCATWSRKYTKVEAGRNALRQTIKILEKRVDELTQQNSTLKKDVEGFISLADREKEAKSKEYDKRVTLEKEITALKSEQTETTDTNHQVSSLLLSVSDLEKQIVELKKLLDKEKSRADTAVENAQVEKAKAAKAWEAAKLEKSRAEKDKTRACTESKRAQEYKSQLDALKNEVAEARSHLTLATSKSEEANIRLEAERKKTYAELKQANLKIAEAEKQKSLIGAYEKKLADENHRVNLLSSQLDEEKKKNEEMLKTINELQKKISDLVASSKYSAPDDKGISVENLTTHVKTEKTKANRKKKCANSKTAKVVEQRTLIQPDTMKSVEEKCQEDKLTHTLQEIRETAETSPNKLIAHSQNTLIACSQDAQPEKVTYVSPRKNSCDGHELLLKDQIKIVKARAKRKVDKLRNSILKKELDDLKHDFFRLSNTLDFLDRSLSRKAKGATVAVKAQHSPSLRWKEQKFLDIKPLAGCSYKDLYDNSAKNSSRASFSDCWSMDSQGKFDSSTTSSNLVDGISLQMTDSRLLGDATELMHGDMPVMVSKTAVRSHSNVISGGDPVHHKKRKRILSLLDSVQYALSDSRKIQMQTEENVSILHRELQSLVASPAERNNMACNSLYDTFDKSCKKRKIFHEQKVSSQCLPNGAHSAELDTENPELRGVTTDLDKGCSATMPANNLPNGDMVCKSINVASTNENDHNSSERFGQMNERDYMMMLDLDDHDDERHYQVARDNLSSPSLPEIEFQKGNIYSVDGVDLTIKDASNAGFSSPHFILNVNHVDDSHNLSEHDSWTACKPLVLESRDFYHRVDCSSSKECIEHGSRDLEVEGSNLEAHETRCPCEPLLTDDFAKLCVVHSEIVDRDHLSRVFHATRKGTSQCHLSSPPGLLLKRVLEYISHKDIPPKDKACIFLSVILAGSHVAALRELSHPIRETNLILNSYMADIFSVMNNVDTRNRLDQALNLHELLNFIGEFIMDGRIWVCLPPDKNLSESGDSNVSILVDDMKLFLEAASTEQLVVASSILASLCVSFDEIDFIVFLSYDLFRLRKYNNEVTLLVIHIFAHLAGRKFLISTSNNLLTGVVKSLVSLLESSQSPCSKCLLSEEVVPLDTIISLLLERLQSLMETAKTQILGNDSLEEIPFHGTHVVGLSSSLEETFSQFTDVLSLLELIANYVSWDILSSKVVSELLPKLESSTINIFSVPIIVILGQFGRLGVTANGLEDTWVVRISCQLTGLLGDDSSRKLMFPIQVAVVCSLLEFINLDPNSLLCSAEIIPPVDKASSACQIRRWFTSLSEEQQSISMGILRDTLQCKQSNRCGVVAYAPDRAIFGSDPTLPT